MLPTPYPLREFRRFASECRSVFDAGLAKVVLRVAQEVRVLKIQFPDYDHWMDLQREEPINHFSVDPKRALGATTMFPHLYELALSECRVDPGHLYHFLL